MRSSRTDLIEQQRIDDAVARKGIDHEPLLIGGGHLLRRRIEVEDALVEVVDRLHHRDLPVQPRVGDDLHRLAELEHDGLLVLVHDEQREVGGRRNRADDHHEGGK